MTSEGLKAESDAQGLLWNAGDSESPAVTIESIPFLFHLLAQASWPVQLLVPISDRVDFEGPS